MIMADEAKPIALTSENYPELSKMVNETTTNGPSDFRNVVEPISKDETVQPPIIDLEVTAEQPGSSKRLSDPLRSITLIQPTSIIYSQFQQNFGETFTILRFTNSPTKFETEIYRLLTFQNIILEELNPNVNFEEVIISPLKLQSLTIKADVTSDFILKVVKQCTALKAFKLLGEIQGNLLRPQSMASIIEESFPNLKEFEIDIGSFNRASQKISDNISEKLARDSMALLKSTTPWAPKLEHVKFSSVITPQWNPYQTLLRLLGFMKLHSKSLKKLDLVLSVLAPIDRNYDNNLTKSEAQTVESILKELLDKMKFSKLKHLGLDLSIKELTHWLKLLMAQRHLETVALKMTTSSFKWPQVCNVMTNNYQTLKEIKITCDFSPKVDFSVVRRCKLLNKLSLRHSQNPKDFKNRNVLVESLDLKHQGMTQLEFVTLIGFEFNILEIERMADNCSTDVKLKGLAIHSGKYVPLGDSLGLEVGTSPPDLGFTRESLKKLLRIRTLEGLIMDFSQFHFNSAFHMACFTNFVDSVSDSRSHGMFKIGNTLDVNSL